MQRSKQLACLVLAMVVVLAVAVPTVLAAGQTRIALKPSKSFPAARGTAKFESKPGERELHVEVEHIRRLAGKRVVFFVGGVKVASAKVNRLGAAEINRNSERGQLVPRVRAGTKVRVRTTGGTLIVSGSF
jgi:hypothetical protein